MNMRRANKRKQQQKTLEDEWTRLKRDRVLSYASAALRSSRKMVLRAVSADGHNLQFASDELRNDWDVVMEAVLSTQEAFAFASDKLRGDREMVELVLSIAPSCLRHASEELRGDKEMVMTAVSKNGLVLQYASDELRGDKEIVMTAVSKNGLVLQYASEGLRGNRELVMRAVSENGSAVEWSAKELRDDPQIIAMAFANVHQDRKLWGLKVMLLSGRSCNVFRSGWCNEPSLYLNPEKLCQVITQAALDLGVDMEHIWTTDNEGCTLVYNNHDIYTRSWHPHGWVFDEKDWHELMLVLH